MKVNYEDIFEHIGYLVYSIALPHGALTELSLAKLGSVINFSWKDGGSLSVHLNDGVKSGVEFCRDNFMTSFAGKNCFSHAICF